MTTTIPLRSCSTTWLLSAFADEAGDACDVQIAALKRAGLRHIDLRGIDGFNISALPLDKATAIRKKLDAAGITVGMFGSPIGKIDIADDFKIDLDKLRHLGALADVLGCRSVRIFSYFNKQNAPADKWRAESLTRLRGLRDLAVELNLTLYHENEAHIFGDKSADVTTIARELRGHKPGGPFRMIYDFDNYNRTGQEPWSIWLEQRDAVDGFHLKDSDASGAHVLIGQGSTKSRDILADALSRGWAGPVSLEPHLKHSKAVMATGPSGKANVQFAEMSEGDCFHAAAQAAVTLLGGLKAPLG
ncbi:MAG: sugar phosphate isomerase/epimerase [Planctomycetes bacterium]|nr:sugar phosphate isomerase/epimerase [Planctomycetota bacterium]